MDSLEYKINKLKNLVEAFESKDNSDEQELKTVNKLFKF